MVDWANTQTHLNVTLYKYIINYTWPHVRLNHTSYTSKILAKYNMCLFLSWIIITELTFIQELFYLYSELYLIDIMYVVMFEFENTDLLSLSTTRQTTEYHTIPNWHYYITNFKTCPYKIKHRCVSAY